MLSETKKKDPGVIDRTVFIPEARRLWQGEISEEEFWTKTRERWNEW